MKAVMKSVIGVADAMTETGGGGEGHPGILALSGIAPLAAASARPGPAKDPRATGWRDAMDEMEHGLGARAGGW